MNPALLAFPIVPSSQMKLRDLITYALGTETLKDYEGLCGEIANQILVCAGRGNILFIEPIDEYLCPMYNRALLWGFHQVAVIDGLVCDPWNPGEPSPIEVYLKEVFPGQKYKTELFAED